MTNLFKALGLSLALSGAATAPAFADGTGIGIGLNWVFGSGYNGGLAAGAKLFSDRSEDHSALSVGLDYHFASESLRPNLGIAYIGDSTYIDANFGYNIGAGAVDFGLGGGFVNSKD